MKQALLAGILALTVGQAYAQPCQLTGTIKDLGAKPLIFWYDQAGRHRADTVRAANGHFTYTARPSDDGLIALYISGARFTRFWYEPGKLSVTGDAARPWQLAIVGTPENNVLTQYQRDVAWKFDQARLEQPAATKRLQEQEHRATLQFLKSHSASRTSAELLYEQLLPLQEFAPEYEALYKSLSRQVQQGPQGQLVARQLTQLRNRPVAGRLAPGFSIADTAGEQVSLAAYRGRYVLLDFWGHWCGPCIKSMPKLNALHEQYATKLTVIGIAAETANDLPAWKRAIRKNKIPGLQLSELKSDEGPVLARYNVNAFPTYLLLNRQGVVLTRTSELSEIEAKLATLTDL